MARDQRTGRYVSAERTTGWPPAFPEDPGWAGDTPWAGGDAVRWAPRDGLDELDPRFPIDLSGPPPVFWALIKHPPDGAPWAPHLDFTVDQAARALAAERAPAETFVVPLGDTAPIPVIRVPVARTYPELEPDTLAHEFSEADRDRLAFTLGGGA
jgi:hypothetical protein